MKSTSLAITAFFFLAACGEPELADLNGDGQGDPPGSVTQIAPVYPKAALSGYVYDASTGLALDGVTISVHTGHGTQATTSSAGFVNLGDLPAGGEAIVALAKEGFVSTRTTVMLPDNAGDFPSTSNHANFGEIGLLPSTALTTTLFDEELVGLSGVTVSMHFPVQRIHNGSSRGSVMIQATSNDQGILRFENAPALAQVGGLNGIVGGAVTIHLSADESGPGITNYLNYTQFVDLGRLPSFVRRGSELLNTFRQGGFLRLVHANVADMVVRRQQPKTMDSGTPFRLLFDSAVDPSGLFINLSDENSENTVAVSTQFSAGGRMLTITPDEPLPAGSEYNLFIGASPSEGQGGRWTRGANILTTSSSDTPFSDAETGYNVAWNDRNGNQEIDGGDDLTLVADLPIGLRSNGGTGRASSGLAEYAFTGVLDTENSVFGESDYMVNGTHQYPQLYLEESTPGNGAQASGYTSTIRLRLPSAAGPWPVGMDMSINLLFIFDNPNRLNDSNQVRMPSGQPLGRYEVRLLLP